MVIQIQLGIIFIVESILKSTLLNVDSKNRHYVN